MQMEVIHIDGDGLPEHISYINIKEETIDKVEEQLALILIPAPTIILN